MPDFQKAKQYAINLLSSELSSDFIYHNLDHTIDVYEAIIRFSKLEGVNDHELLLLKTAALYHDIGLIYGIHNHEESAVTMVKEILPRFNYSQKDIQAITKMIMATELPQSPNCLLEELLCDADLDYLGRDDFFMTSSKLHLEWKRMKVIDLPFEEWIKLEMSFLKSHSYFTPAAKKLRDKCKTDNLTQIENICGSIKKDCS